MNYRYYQTSHPNSQKMGEYIAEGFGAQILPVSTYVPGAVAIVYGILRGTDRIIHHCEVNDFPYIYVDHAFFYKCRGQVGDEKAYFRLIRNGRYWNDSYDLSVEGAASLDRWTSLGIDVAPFHKSGDKVVIVPMSRYVAAFNNVDPIAWQDALIKELTRHTFRDIVIKPKDQGKIEGLDSVFAKAHCFVTSDSLSAISAVLNGVPVFTSVENPAAPLGLQDLSKIEDPFYPSVDTVINHCAVLSHQQFTIAEIKSGFAKEVLESHDN